jgi:addiction module RelB/DinJ family antitoxin
MNTTVINFKTSLVVKSKAQAIAEELGLSLSAVINALLKQFVRTKSINVSLKVEPSPYMINALKESGDDIKKGRIYSFTNTNDALNFLHDNSKKYGKKNNKS